MEIEKPIEEIRDGVVALAINEARELRKKSKTLRDSSDFGGEEYDLDAFKAILKEYKVFEKKVPSMELLYMAYNDIAIAHLDAMEFKKATEYACALIHLCKEKNDEDGYKAAMGTLGNIAIATNNFDLAIKAYVALNGQDGSELLMRLTYGLMQQNKNDIPAPNLKMPTLEDVSLFKKPSSFAFIADPEKKRIENNIRMFMAMFNISRQQAKDYLSA